MKNPNESLLDWQEIHHRNAQLPFSYEAVGATAGPYPRGYDHDDRQVFLGTGRAVFDAGKEAIRNWRMFPTSWTWIYAPDGQQPGTTVSMAFRLLGRWWVNACRIVYLVDDPNRYGFAYGTLSQHVEQGEELFEVRLEPDGKVFFRITAFSRPNKWYVRLAYPWARLQQRKFVRDAFAQMRRLVAHTQQETHA